MSAYVVVGQIVRIHYLNARSDQDSWLWAVVNHVDDNAYTVITERQQPVLLMTNEESLRKYSPKLFEGDVYKPSLRVERPTKDGKPLMAKRQLFGGYKISKSIKEVKVC